jgi:hypothetical protein
MPDTDSYDTVFARLKANGEPDTSIGPDGLFEVEFPDSYPTQLEYLYASALDSLRVWTVSWVAGDEVWARFLLEP